jgi:hypothetical protein
MEERVVLAEELGHNQHHQFLVDLTQLAKEALVVVVLVVTQTQLAAAAVQVNQAHSFSMVVMEVQEQIQRLLELLQHMLVVAAVDPIKELQDQLTGVVLVEAELEVLMLPESPAIQILEAVEVEVGIRQEELVDQV